MVDLIYILDKIDIFIEGAKLDGIPLGNILIASLSVFGVFSLVKARVKGGK